MNLSQNQSQGIVICGLRCQEGFGWVGVRNRHFLSSAAMVKIFKGQEFN